MSVEVAITATPTAVPNLDDGQNYVIENQSYEDIFAEIATAAPADGSASARAVFARSRLEFSLASGQDLYVWYKSEGAPHGGEVIIETVD